MENSGEHISPPVQITTPLKEVKIITDRQESFQKQLDTLNPDRKDHQVLAKFLAQLYDYKHYGSLDEEFSKNTNVRYQPKSALDGVVTPAPFGDIYGIYEYQPIATAVEQIEDPFNIFPDIQEIFKQSEGKDNSEIEKEIAKVIKEKTDISISFEDQKNETEIEKWGILENGNVYSKSITDKSVGIRKYVYKGNSKIISDLEKQGYSEDMDFKPVGDIIIINNLFIDNPRTIGTCLHELGHIVEDRFILPQKEEQYKDKSILSTEIISSLYGLKASFLMAEHNPDIAMQMMISPVSTYNWALTGTVAP